MRLCRLLLVTALAAAISGCDEDGLGAAGTCTPDATEPCSCAASRPGERTCSPEGDAWTACICAACGAVPITASGAIHTSAASITFDTAPASAFLEFAGLEGLCLGHALLSVGDAGGCALDLEYGAAEGTYGGIRSIVLTVGPGCPGFSAEQEGIYRTTQGWGAGWWSGPATRRAGEDCAEDASFGFPDGAVQLSRDDGASLDVNLRDLAFAGDVAFLASGSPFIGCVVDGCSPSTHDGGGGWCVALGACAPGNHDGGDGTCMAAGRCVPGLSVDRAGNCRAWEATGSMAQGRYGHAAVRLPSGEVLVTGGYTGEIGPHDPMTSELYDPGARSWRAAGPPLFKHEEGAYAQLADGRVLAVGGFDSYSSPPPGGPHAGGTTVAEIFTPPTAAGGAGAWTSTGGLATERYHHAATALGDGRILVTGGESSVNVSLASAEIFDPSTGTWTATGSMQVARNEHAAARLGDGRVLVVGGMGAGTSAETYDPATGTFTAVGSTSEHRSYPVAVSLPDGRALVLGGFSYYAEIFDPVANAFVTSAIVPSHSYVSATPLADGSVLLVGSDGAALLDPATGTVLDLPPPGGYRWGASATRLADGAVLVAGGAESAELYLGGGLRPATP